MAELKKLNLDTEKVYLESDNDGVFDFIASMEDSMKKTVYEALGSNPDNDINISFILYSEKKNNIPVYGFIHKFAKEGDSGLIYALSLDQYQLAAFAIERFGEEPGKTIADSILEKS